MIRMLIIFSIAFGLGISSAVWGSEKFLSQNQILQMSGLILSINIPSVIFLVGRLIDAPVDFSNAMKEVKHNVYFMFIAFIGMLVISIFDPFVLLSNLIIDWCALDSVSAFLSKSASKTAIMTFFFLQIYALSEIAKSMFYLAHEMNKRNRKE